MLPSASYWRPWSSKAWESSWPITTPIAPEDFHNNQSSPFSISEIDDDSLSVEFELSLSMKIWIWPKLRLGGLAMLKKGACKIPAGKAIWVRDAATKWMLYFQNLVVERRVVGVDGGRGHPPLCPVDRLWELSQVLSQHPLGEKYNNRERSTTIEKDLQQ